VNLRLEEIEKLRMDMIKVTKEILELAAKRCRIAGKIGELKRKIGLRIVDKEVEKRLIEECLMRCDDLGLRREFCEKLLKLLIDEAVRVQEARMDEVDSRRL